MSSRATTFAAALLATLMVPGAALAADADKTAGGQPAAMATFIGTEGSEIGTAEITPTVDGALIHAEIEGLPADSWVAFHIHETGTCTADDGFKSAGGHFNPTGAKHGFLVDGGPHAGDMPNQYVDGDGVLRTQVLNTAVTLNEGDTAILGKAIVIHDGTDDYESQPSGDAGSRIACAVIEGQT